ncbi:MAG: ImmA/IrrE family metallo-endopeptidase [Cyclobacteriaceae bacterium]
MRKEGNEFRRREIESLAEWLADNYFGEDYIIEPDLIASENNITYSYGHYRDYFDGLLEHESGQFHIYINLDRLTQKDTPRARFTFAHELGHYFIDEHRNALASGKTPSHASFNSLLSKNPVEKEADFFAACLLMPTSSFKNFCRGYKLSSSILKSLSENFDTSLSATIFRYFQLNISPMAIIFSKNAKVEWVMTSNDFKYRWPPKKGSDVPKSTLAGEYFYKNVTPTKEDIIYPDDWFTDFEMDKSEEFYEFCLSRDNSALSVIWKKER